MVAYPGESLGCLRSPAPEQSLQGVDVSTKPVPEVWGEVMMAHGFSHRGTPSISALARKADLSVETVRRFIRQTGVPEAATVAALSGLLGEVFVSGWMGTPTAGDLYSGPDVSRYLNDRQRAAITELINSFVKSHVGISDEPPDVEVRA